ncbi:MAG: hypothetical protein L6Q76_08790 [Polyangiaceae bacterium]|nr:hypothetical protein [Polyangiaceae bacterium]
MSIRAIGRVVEGHLRVDIPVDLPENAEVELAQVDAEFDLDEDEDRLVSADIEEGRAQIARGERGTPAKEFIKELRAMRSPDEALPGGCTRKG